MVHIRKPAGLNADPYARAYFTAADRGYLAESYPAENTQSSVVPSTAGRLEFVKLKLPVAASVANLVMFVVTAGNTLTTGQCFGVLFSPAGARIAPTADQAASWVSTGLKTMPLTGGPFALPAADYYAAVWFNGTTAPAWPRNTNLAAGLTNAGFAAPNLLCGTADLGLTTTAPTNMGTQTANSSRLWAALS